MQTIDNVKLANFESYGNYSSSNYGVNALMFEDGKENRFYFSYKTLVAFSTPSSGLVVHANVWGTTTGKHLNWIDNKGHKSRVSSSEFQALYNKVFGK